MYSKVLNALDVITTVAGGGSSTSTYSGDGYAATSATFNNPVEVALDLSGNFEQSFVFFFLFRTSLTHSLISFILGNLYIADCYNHRIRKVTVLTGIITTISGTGIQGYSGDGSAATSATLNNPFGVAVDLPGNVYIGDYGNHRIRKVTVSTGNITTIAGGNGNGYNSDNIAATSTKLAYPEGVAVDSSGNFYIADSSNCRIRKVTASTGIITTIAGTGVSGFSGDGSAATSATLNQPHNVALDLSGNVYFSDWCNHRIRKVTASTGIITTIAGSGAAGQGVGSYNGDNIAATSATLNDPVGVAVDLSGNVYIGDYDNHRTRKVTVSTGNITTIAGGGSVGYSDNVEATSIYLPYPQGVAVDSTGNVYISNRSRIYKVTMGVVPSSQPSSQPSRQPSSQPSRQPSSQPSRQPSSQPTSTPTSQPTNPTGQPSSQPTDLPSSQPSSQPTSLPSSQPSSQPTSLPSSQTSPQPTSIPSSQPTSLPTCGFGSEVEGTGCLTCSAGKYNDKHHSDICVDCPIGTYTSVSNSKGCTPCAPGTSTTYAGSASCDAIYVNTDVGGTIGIAAVAIVSYFSFIYYSNEAAWIVIAFSVVPFMDVYSDVQYILMEKFYNMTIFVLILLVFMVANLMFLFQLFYKMKAFPVIQEFPGNYLVGSSFIWLNAVQGQPYINGSKFEYSLEEHDGMEKFLYYWLVWICLVVAQIGYIVVIYPLWIVFYSLFLCLWLAIGFFLFQTKLLAISKLWNLWFTVWTQSDKFHKTVNIDVAIIHQSTLNQFLLETMPQLILQCTNGYISNVLYTPTSIFSILFSILVIVNSFYRYGYYLLWKKKSFGDIPLPLALKVTHFVSSADNLSVKSILMTLMHSKKTGNRDSDGDVTFLSAQKNKLLENYSKLDILYITLIAINGEEVAEILTVNGVSKATQLVNNTDTVHALARHLNKLMDGNESSSSYSFYKEVKESVFALTGVAPEVDGFVDDNDKHKAMYGTAYSAAISKLTEITVHHDDYYGHENIYGLDATPTAVVQNPLSTSRAITGDASTVDAVSRDWRDSYTEKH